VTGSLTSLSDAFIQITSEGGAIADDASIVFDTGSFSANSLLLQIDSLHGTIGGDPIINLTATGTVTTTGDATVDYRSDTGLRAEQKAGHNGIDRDRLNNFPANARILSTRGDFAPNESAFDRNAGRIPLQVP
jgi:hypothetical protein